MLKITTIPSLGPWSASCGRRTEAGIAEISSGMFCYNNEDYESFFHDFEPELNRKQEKTVILVGTKTGTEPKENIGLF
ncbi:hypothetical protein TNCV_1192991 [Trichonephila clavipes]|nr:hypothetical protein TNCV_1192991 [Trichonephila clavipes]